MAADEPPPAVSKPTAEQRADEVFRHLVRAPHGPPPRVKLLIFSTPRSGSSLFCRILRSMAAIGPPLEWLNELYIRAYGSASNLGSVPVADYWRFVQAKATSPEGVFAVKVHVRDYIRTLNHGIDPLSEGFDGVYFVHRRDKLAQAMSLAKAKASGQWHASQRPLRVIGAGDISNGDILNALRDIAEQEEQYRAVFAGRVRREFLYEDFSTRPDVVRTVCDDLGLPITAQASAESLGEIQRTAEDAERLRELRTYLGIG